MYVEALVNGKATKALMDTSATHNFVSKDEVKRLELQASKEGGWFKAINSAAKPSQGVARRVTMHIGSWEGRVDFTVAPMDYFEMVPGMDFLQKVKAMPLPFLRTMDILEEEKPCMVPTVTKGKRDDGSGEPMPKKIEEVLDEFKDVMPPELPKRLSPIKEEDHKIELELGTKPPAMGAYKMAPPELEKLRRQLKELLDVGFIQPSKARMARRSCFRKNTMGPFEYVSTTEHSTR
ncbi:hypothetical protein CK203_049483 [Vitis vinifera]|uniref:Uncharacterized protein n=1 Tax=Vitis vinifera TaxID=29760 RepID=A0A438HAX2_VITVI|nr:hypothetical protein CK203_049483 [Vitis vinifera]